MLGEQTICKNWRRKFKNWGKYVLLILLSYLDYNIARFMCCMRLFWVGGIPSMVLLFLVYKIHLHWFTLLIGHILSYIWITNCSMMVRTSSVNVSTSDILEKTVEVKIFQRVLNDNKWRTHIKIEANAPSLWSICLETVF